MSLVGIDFSLNSPAACVSKNNNYDFISFFNYGDRPWSKLPIKKAFHIHNELMDMGAIKGIHYNRNVSSKTFLDREREKMEDSMVIANLINDYLKNHYKIKAFAIEGFSYGSKGNSFIDMIQYNSRLRQILIESYGINNFYIFQPTKVKKLAGKGNCNKNYMFNAFKNNFLEDSNLNNSLLWKWCQDKEFVKDVPKPLDDLVDSYFILKLLETLII